MVYKGETQIHALPNRQLVGAKEFSTVSINALAINFVSAAVGTVPAYIAAPAVFVQISCRNAEKSVFRTPAIPFLKNRYPVLQRNIGKLIFVVISGLIKTVIIDAGEHADTFSCLHTEPQINIMLRPGGRHHVGAESRCVFRFFGDNVNDATHRFTSVQRGGGAFHNFNPLDQRIWNSGETIHGTQRTYHWHSVN